MRPRDGLPKYRGKTKELIRSNSKFLFIGNSHTFVNDLPFTFAQIARSGGQNVEVAMLASPGVSLGWHAEQPQTRANIQKGQWDYIVLQQVAHPFAGLDNLLSEAGTLVEMMKSTQATPVLFMPWASKNDPAGQAILDESYRIASKKLGALLAPVGTAWWKLLNEQRELDLFDPDLEHANPAGSYLAACVFYSLVYQRSPEGLHHPSCLGKTEAQLLQRHSRFTAAS